MTPHPTENQESSATVQVINTSHLQQTDDPRKSCFRTNPIVQQHFTHQKYRSGDRVQLYLNLDVLTHRPNILSQADICLNKYQCCHWFT